MFTRVITKYTIRRIKNLLQKFLEVVLKMHNIANLQIVLLILCETRLIFSPSGLVKYWREVSHPTIAEQVVQQMLWNPSEVAASFQSLWNPSGRDASILFAEYLWDGPTLCT